MFIKKVIEITYTIVFFASLCLCLFAIIGVIFGDEPGFYFVNYVKFLFVYISWFMAIFVINYLYIYIYNSNIFNNSFYMIRKINILLFSLNVLFVGVIFVSAYIVS